MKLLIITIFALLLTACNRHQPKAWVSVEKAPMRVIYVDYYKDINESTVKYLARCLRDVKFNNYKFNEVTGINVKTCYKLDYKDEVTKTLNKN